MDERVKFRCLLDDGCSRLSSVPTRLESVVRQGDDREARPSPRRTGCIYVTVAKGLAQGLKTATWVLDLGVAQLSCKILELPSHDRPRPKVADNRAMGHGPQACFRRGRREYVPGLIPRLDDHCPTLR